MVGDYMSMPLGKGGFHTIGLFMDVYSQKIFGFKFTTYGSTTTTITSLNCIWQMYRMPKVFMADGGSHFTGTAVGEWCIEHNSRYQQVAAYSPWVNGLLEGTNGKLLSRLKRLCAPNLGEDEWAKITKFEDLPAVWPDHFYATIKHLNHRILPAYKFSLNELCLGTVVNTLETPITVSSEELAEASVAIQNEYVGQQNLDAYSHILDHANKWKAAFDKKVLASRDGVIEYKKCNLVQICESKLDFTLATEAKLLP
jgi:transposase InsO family protein